MSGTCRAALALALLAGAARGEAASPTTAIKVDQAGYLPKAPKLALVSGPGAAGAFTVRRTKGGSIAFRGNLSAPVSDHDTGDAVQTADFTGLTAPGEYYLDAEGVGRSWDFKIGGDVYSRTFYLAMRSYYGQRCGTAVDLGPEYPAYKHAACHLKGAWHPSSGRSGERESAKGWHDAGDYGRYVVNSGVTTGSLLWSYELYTPRLRNMRLNIPESGNKTPDILNEIRWNLEWMLTMQDADGGVWHKQTSERFCGFVMPEADTLVSYVIGTGEEPYKNSCATADFAAAMAIAARIYRPFDAVFAARALKAAERAWTWLDKHPDVTFRNPPGVQTGSYDSPNCRGERLWAAAELWRTTHQELYNGYFLAHFSDFRKSVSATGPPSWESVAPLALWTYTFASSGDAGAKKTLTSDLLAAADAIAARTGANPYHVSLVTDEYKWGSNGIAANYGMELLVAHAMHPDSRYLNAALDNVHYLLGRNTFSVSWVTQVGENAFQHPHHRPSGAMKSLPPWPGLLSGGPNSGRQDAVAHALPANLPPAKVYADDAGSYSTNEIAINWNAALVFLLSGVLPGR